MTREQTELPDGWKWVKLGKVSEINPRRQSLDRPDDIETTFVPMPSVDDLTGEITAPEIKPYSEVKKGYTYFEEGDVIFAKITPCMQNGKHAVAKNLIDGIAFGSTEFHVIRPNPDVKAEWIHLFLRQPGVLNDAMKHFTGAVGQQRVPKNYLENLEIPLPSLKDQVSIIAHLNECMSEIDKARAATEAQLEAAEMLPQIYRYQMFSDLKLGEYQRKKIKDIAKIQTGFAFKSDWYVSDGINLLRNANIAQGYLDWSDSVFLSQKRFDEFKAFELLEGDIVLALDRPIVSKGLKVARLIEEDLPALLVQRVARFILDSSMDADYMYQYINSPYFIGAISGHDQSLGVPHISPKQVGGVEIPVPDLGRQQKIVADLEEKLHSAQSLINYLNEQLNAINALPAALLKKAFSGELTRQLSPEELRTALTCLAVDRLHQRQAFGVVQLMKVLYFAQAHYGIPLGYAFKRYTYGPFGKAVYDLEKQGKAEGWFYKEDSRETGSPRYLPDSQLTDKVTEATKLLSTWQNEVDELLRIAETFDTRGLELLATLYAVWNDLLLESEQVTDREIIEAVNEWPEKAGKFARLELQAHLAYLREQKLIPKGTGQSTKVVS